MGSTRYVRVPRDGYDHAPPEGQVRACDRMFRVTGKFTVLFLKFCRSFGRLIMIYLFVIS